VVIIKAMIKNLLPIKQKNKRTHISIGPAPVARKKPDDLHAKYSFASVQARAVAGFIASKLSSAIGKATEESDRLFYQSFKEEKGEEHSFFNLSKRLVYWIQEREDVLGNIEQLDISPQTKRELINIYKEDACYLHEVLKIEKSKSCSTLVDRQKQLETNTEWDIYRDVIYAVTNKKLLLSTPEEIKQLSFGEIVYMGEIKERADIPNSRKEIRETLEQMQVGTRNMMNWLLAISEVITNIIKHAEEGSVIVKRDNNQVYVIVEDRGPGFDLENLPSMTLMAGYSTKKSMGQGFHLMLKMTKQIILSNNERGSTIILKFTKKEDELQGKVHANPLQQASSDFGQIERKGGEDK
jgi:anti-sigma regulatory factor (Ser/Thr protein kinase)